MRGLPAQHRILARFLSGLDARDPSLIDIPVPVNSIPVAGPLISPLVGDSSGDSTQPPTSPSPPPGNPPPGTTLNLDGGVSNGQGNGNVPTPTNPPLSTSGGDQNGLLVSVVFNVDISPTPTPGSPSGSFNAQSASGAGSATSPLSTGVDGDYMASNGQNMSVMAGATPSSFDNSTPGTSPGVVATNALAPSQSSLGSGSNIVSAPTSPTISTVGAISSGERLSGATIAGIIIACLVSLLVLILLLVRRRAIARRVELRNQWWFNRTSGGNSYFVSRPRSPVKVNSDPSTSRLSVASSFATNFDQGLMFRVESPSRFSLGVLPDLPPTAEVRERNSVLVSTGDAVSRGTSVFNNGSDEGAQYLAVSTGQGSLESFTPMSVRPFSPSESFFFPKPPAPHPPHPFFVSAPPDPMSSQSSATTLVQISTPPRAFMTDLPPASAPTPLLQPQTSIPATAFPPSVATINSPDPFADPANPESMGVEIVCRPFVRSLEDELVVYRGDHVRIFQIFHDGWAFVEKLANTKGEHSKRGLIPVDCLWEADQSLPTPLARQRVSYGPDQLVGCAL